MMFNKYVRIGLIGCSVLALQACGERDWQATATADVEHMFTTLRDSHPGPVDPNNPGFASALDANYARALALASEVEDEAGYFYALRAFTTPFQDAHLSVGFYRAIEREQAWPGFVVTGDGRDVTVVSRATDAAPPVGALLLGCDGQSITSMIETRVQPFIGNWSVASARAGDLPYLVIDSDNPFVPRLTACDFETADGRETYTLEWQPYTDEIATGIANRFEPRIENGVGLRWVGNIAWISVGSLDVTNPETATDFATLQSALAEQADALVAADRIVIDLRGNLGGASEPGRALAASLFGADFIAATRPRITQVEWRASRANLDKLDLYLPMMETALGADAPVVARMQQIHAGMSHALETGDAYFSEPAEARPAFERAPMALDIPPVFVLTGRRCVSACLDLVDTLKATDRVTQIGQPTSGDTHYLEVITEDLPSGIAQLSFPTAVHRGRARADNAVHEPELVFNGDMQDLEALEAWVRDLEVEP